MLRFAKTDIGRGFVPDTAAGRKTKDIYDRYAGNRYRQACSPSATVRWPSRLSATSSLGNVCRLSARSEGGFQDRRRL